MRRLGQIAIASGLALTAAVGMAAFMTLRPTVLRVAVPTGSEDYPVILAASQAMAREKSPVRFRLVPVDSASASAAAMEANDADFAVVRSDIAMPASGATAVILHRNSIVLVTPADSKFDKILDLRGKTVACLKTEPAAQDTGANERLLDSILRQYDLPPASVTRFSATVAEVPDILRERRADAVLAIGTASTGLLHEAISAAAPNGEPPPNFVAIPEAEAIAQRSTAFESMKVLRGAFGGAPPRPARSFDTLAVTTRLVARTSLPDAQVADVTRFFFSKRGLIAERAPLAARIEAPSTDKDAALPVHPGAAAYLDSDEETFFDRYSDVFYIGAMLLSVLGSGLAALASRITANKRARIEDSIERLLEILKSARCATSPKDLQDLVTETDGILHGALASAPGAADPHRLGALTLALEQARLAIKERQRALETAARDNVLPGPTPALIGSVSRDRLRRPLDGEHPPD